MMNKFNKYLYIFIFSVMTTLIFLIEFKPYIPIEWTTIDSSITFFEELSHSLRDYDISHLLLFVFIYFFYSSVYFNDRKKKSNNKTCIIVSMIFSIFTIVCKSYLVDNTLNNIYLSSVQVVKTIIYFLGFYFAYYAIILKIVNAKIDFDFSKKKTS